MQCRRTRRSGTALACPRAAAASQEHLRRGARSGVSAAGQPPRARQRLAVLGLRSVPLPARGRGRNAGTDGAAKGRDVLRIAQASVACSRQVWRCVPEPPSGCERTVEVKRQHALGRVRHGLRRAGRHGHGRVGAHGRRRDCRAVSHAGRHSAALQPAHAVMRRCGEARDTREGGESGGVKGVMPRQHRRTWMMRDRHADKIC